ncbi:cytochrome P450 [Mycena sp. CBHHK59/15]|nr:cytochrome P450 [Mycena sp. CBHHK59/15]
MPYTIGLQSAASAFLSAGFATQFTAAVVIFLVIVLVTSSHQEDGLSAPKSLPGLPFLAIVPFFRQRYNFLNWGFHVTGESIFQFQLMRHTVIVLSGAPARSAFFYAKGFDLTEGFKILSGAIPMVSGVTSGLQTKRITLIHKRLAAVQRNAPLSELIPIILEDSRRIMKDYGTAGTFDPFEKIYELIFQTTVRSLSCSEISDDAALVARLKTLYDRLDSGTTPATVLVPWLPTPAMVRKLWATKEIYDIVSRAINAREQSGIARNDTLQMLLDAGDEKLVVVGFIMGLLIAGARATGTTGAYICAEVEALLAAMPAEAEAGPTLSARLAAVPLARWEADTPVLDAVIRETLRVAQPHTAMRRNLGPDVYIGDKRVPSGAYVVYPFSDVHLDPALYPEPWRFDPARQEPCAAALPYVGWGVGRTTCLGTRLAKVELKLTTTMFLLAFDHTVVDSTGETPDPLPRPNWNDILLCRPPAGSCYVRYRRTDVAL